MSRMVAIAPLTLLLLFGTPVCAQGTVPQFAVVESFAEALSAGRVTAALAYFERDAVWSEYDLMPRAANGLAEAMQRAHDLVDANVRLEIELVATHAGGMVLVTHERMWGDFVPGELAPLRSVTVYVVEHGVIKSLSRVLEPDQRDAWIVRQMVLGAWPSGWHDFRFRIDGRFVATPRPSLVRRLGDSGSFAVASGVLTFVSDEASQDCDAGDVGAYELRFLAEDRFQLRGIHEACLKRGGPGKVGVFNRTEAE